MKYIKQICQELRSFADPSKAQLVQKYFKTGVGEYGAGDKFLGIPIPQQRSIVKKYFSLVTVEELFALLESKIHEERGVALLILVTQYQRTTTLLSKKNIYNFYCKNTRYINNWDLVDISAYHIVGAYLLDKNKAPLYKFAKSQNLWERRIAIVSTWWFIRHGLFQDTLKITLLLLQDRESLIHKACGWMLREVGKKDFSLLDNFLVEYYATMPRTMLRYAIEKFPEELRKSYLRGTR